MSVLYFMVIFQVIGTFHLKEKRHKYDTHGGIKYNVRGSP